MTYDLEKLHIIFIPPILPLLLLLHLEMSTNERNIGRTMDERPGLFKNIFKINDKKTTERFKIF